MSNLTDLVRSLKAIATQIAAISTAIQKFAPEPESDAKKKRRAKK